MECEDGRTAYDQMLPDMEAWMAGYSVERLRRLGWTEEMIQDCGYDLTTGTFKGEKAG